MKNLLLRVLSVIIIAVSAPMSANASSLPKETEEQ